MSQPVQSDQVRQALALGAVGFGVLAVAAPRVFTALYGLTANPNVRVMTRLWGTRTAALGAVMLTAKEPEDRRRLSMMSTAMTALDTVISATAGPDVSARGKILGTATSAAFTAAGAYVLTQR
ncbi:MAG TPA: DUF4267 domain-containing protein [Jatrophihabitans sp.]|jgi:hypothetical protein|uniref:DUF4267 domain-containing protein n=1 Tax=Jatrophihabitans sp. TaxID=1932789 RepID=UPI002E0A4DCD|nr:DUF4267 domain-containing protein [Jatrophihabitans sp.]